MSSIDRVNKKSKQKVSYLSVSMGSTFTAMLLAGFIVGYFFDNFFDSKPFFIIGCGFMGFIGGLMKLHKMSVMESDPNSEGNS